MIILDTDHLVTLKYSQGSDFAALTERMAASPDQDFVTTVVTVEEQLRGWLALIHRSHDIRQQVSPYARLNDLVDFFSCWIRLAFDERTAECFEDLRQRKIRIGTMDLKIAATALVHDSLLLTANRRDFEQVPNLRLEDWLH